MMLRRSFMRLLSSCTGLPLSFIMLRPSFRMHHHAFILLTVFAACINISCVKDKFVADNDAQLEVSSYMLDFDTVFTNKSSITNKVKIKNLSNKKLLVQRIGLADPQTESFHLNINGETTNNKENIIINGGDSIYLFVNLTVPASQVKDPFLIEDKIILNYGSQETFIELKAWARNAHYRENYTVTEDETWEAELPYLIQGKLTINPGVTLTLKQGTTFYLHADAAIIVKGTLIANGSIAEPVVLRNDRLDKSYINITGSWPGVYFENTSTNNQLHHVKIMNALNGISVQGSSISITPQLSLESCVVENIAEKGISANNSFIRANNSLITNCGVNIDLMNGGKYEFTHCTIATYNTKYLFSSDAIINCTNYSSVNNVATSHPLEAIFTNCIIWGEQNNSQERLIASRTDTDAFSLIFEHCLYGFLKNNSLFTILNSIQNQDPEFKLIESTRNIFHFALQEGSPAIGFGKPVGILKDLEGNPRSQTHPDAGCYEFH